MRGVATILAVSCLLLILTAPSRAAPKFAQYPAPVYFGPVGRLDLSVPEAFAYRTRLRAASQGPINFAGHFQIATWGCGTGCVTGAMVDAFTGRVTFLPTVETNGLEAVMDEKFNAFEFRTNSRLIVLSGKLTENGVLGAHFFTWDGAVLVRVDTVPYSAPSQEESNGQRVESYSLPHETPEPAPQKVMSAAASAKGCWSVPTEDARSRCEYEADHPRSVQVDSQPISQQPPSPQYAATSPEATSPHDLGKEFLKIVRDTRDQYGRGTNEMQQGAARPARAKQLCSLLTSLTFTDWVGKVSIVSSNSDGKGVFGVELDQGISLETTNNSFSDSFDHTLIEPSSPVFEQASNTSVGQTVLVSGSFIPSKTDCVEESSITLRGSMTEPAFIVRFSSVKPKS